jgi:hypothetical protein
MGLYGWIIALLTGERLTYFWSCGMTGTLSQAIAHNLSRELGTLDPRNMKLLKLGMSQTAYEFSHVVRLLHLACCCWVPPFAVTHDLNQSHVRTLPFLSPGPENVAKPVQPRGLSPQTYFPNLVFQAVHEHFGLSF